MSDWGVALRGKFGGFGLILCLFGRQPRRAWAWDGDNKKGGLRHLLWLASPLPREFWLRERFGSTSPRPGIRRVYFSIHYIRTKPCMGSMTVRMHMVTTVI